ncbi:alpha/beta fold hydrolase [Actinocrispum sp. NPDC049592]|uniref:thioesterase II family protein n=1 Tax=Actinocrispum sp. NPDC049592 TaxID=3154835 RepID=UPI0034423916
MTTTVTSPWIRRYHPAPTAAVRLVCLPHAGGSASYFHPVSARFSPQTEVIALQYPGRQDRRHERTITDMHTLADQVTAELLALDPKPTVFFGHSMGAVLGFETIKRLEDGGATGPYTLIASGRRGPSTHRDEQVHDQTDDFLIKEIKKLNGTSSTLLADDEILRMALPSLRGDYEAIETYTCPADRKINAPITVLTGDNDPKTTVDEATVWQHHTTATYRIKVFPGGHFFLQEHPTDINNEIVKEVLSLR